MKTLGELIKEYRNKNNLTLREFANICGLSHSYINLLEKGVDSRSNKPVEPTLDTIEKVSKAMGSTSEDILKETGFIVNEPSTTKTSLNINEQEQLDKEAKNILDNFAISLSKNKEYLQDEDYLVLEATIRSALETIKLKNKEKYTPKKYKKNS